MSSARCRRFSARRGAEIPLTNICRQVTVRICQRRNIRTRPGCVKDERSGAGAAPQGKPPATRYGSVSAE